MALKEVYEKKHTKELLERYRLDYNRVHNDVKLIMIEELKKRELITQEEYEEKLNKINEEKKEEKFSREEEELNKIKEEVKVENEEKLRQEKTKVSKEKLDSFNKKNTNKTEETFPRWIYFFIGIVIGYIPINTWINANTYDEAMTFGIILIGIIIISSLLWQFLLGGAILLFMKNPHLAFGIIAPYVILLLWFPLNKNVEQQKQVALSIAAKEKDYKKCEKLLEKYKNKYNSSDSQGYNSLHYALVNKDENLIRLLVENKIYLITKNDLNSYKFFDFSKNTKDIILNDLEILWDGSPNKIIFKEIYETKENQKELIERFYENGMSININSGWNNLLRSVIYSGVSDDEKIRSLDFLIEHGIDMNRYSSYSKENILYELIDRSDLMDTERVIKYTEYFVGKGLNLNSINREKENLLHIAFDNENNKMIDFLIKNKVNLEEKNEKGQIPLLKIFGIGNSKISVPKIKNYLNYYYKNNANPFIADKDKENIIDYIDGYNEKNEDLLEKKDIEEFKNELIKSMKNKNGD